MKKEEVSIKITTPLFEKAELDLLDNYNETMHSMIEEYTKMYLEDKEKVITQRIIICQQEKIDQLTNNWNELKKIIQEQRDNPLNFEMKLFSQMVLNDMENLENKMKEIKENNDEY